MIELVSFTNWKSHMGVRLVFKVVTLNDLEPRSGRYFALFYPKPEPTALKQKKIEARLMVSAR